MNFKELLNEKTDTSNIKDYDKLHGGITSVLKKTYLEAYVNGVEFIHDKIEVHLDKYELDKGHLKTLVGSKYFKAVQIYAGKLSLIFGSF